MVEIYARRYSCRIGEGGGSGGALRPSGYTILRLFVYIACRGVTEAAYCRVPVRVVLWCAVGPWCAETLLFLDTADAHRLRGRA